jgi:hypothetical protein
MPSARRRPALSMSHRPWKSVNALSPAAITEGRVTAVFGGLLGYTTYSNQRQ